MEAKQDRRATYQCAMKASHNGQQHGAFLVRQISKRDVLKASKRDQAKHQDDEEGGQLCQLCS